MGKLGFSWLSSASSNVEIKKLPLQQEERDCDVEELERRDNVVAMPRSGMPLRGIAKHSEVDIPGNTTKTLSEQQFEQLLSNLLKYGVLIASTVVLLGGLLYLFRYGGEKADYHYFQGVPSELCSPTSVVTAALSGNYAAIIQLGLLLLVATPIVRVVISLLAFLRQREYIYCTISLLVLTALIYSLVGAYY